MCKCNCLSDSGWLLFLDPVPTQNTLDVNSFFPLGSWNSMTFNNPTFFKNNTIDFVYLLESPLFVLCHMLVESKDVIEWMSFWGIYHNWQCSTRFSRACFCRMHLYEKMSPLILQYPELMQQIISPKISINLQQQGDFIEIANAAREQILKQLRAEQTSTNPQKDRSWSGPRAGEVNRIH